MYRPDFRIQSYSRRLGGCSLGVTDGKDPLGMGTCLRKIHHKRCAFRRSYKQPEITNLMWFKVQQGLGQARGACLHEHSDSEAFVCNNHRNVVARCESLLALFLTMVLLEPLQGFATAPSNATNTEQGHSGVSGLQLQPPCAPCCCCDLVYFGKCISSGLDVPGAFCATQLGMTCEPRLIRVPRGLHIEAIGCGVAHAVVAGRHCKQFFRDVMDCLVREEEGKVGGEVRGGEGASAANGDKSKLAASELLASVRVKRKSNYRRVRERPPTLSFVIGQFTGSSVNSTRSIVDQVSVGFSQSRTKESQTFRNRQLYRSWVCEEVLCSDMTIALDVLQDAYEEHIVSVQCPGDYSLIASKRLLQPPRLPDPGLWCVAAAMMARPMRSPIEDTNHSAMAAASDSTKPESSRHEHFLRAGELLCFSMHFKSDTGGALRIDILEYMAQQFNSQFDPIVEMTSAFCLKHVENRESTANDNEAQDGEGPRFDEDGDTDIAPKEVAPRLVCSVEFEPLLREPLPEDVNTPSTCYQVVEDAMLGKHLRLHASVEEPPVASNSSSPVRKEVDEAAQNVDELAIAPTTGDDTAPSKPNTWPGPWLRISIVVVQSGTYRLGFGLKSDGRQPPPQVDDVASAFPESEAAESEGSTHTNVSRIDPPLDHDSRDEPAVFHADPGCATLKTSPPPLPILENGVHTVRVGLNFVCYAPPEADVAVCAPLLTSPGGSSQSDHHVSSKQHSLLVCGLPPTEVAILPSHQSGANGDSEENGLSNTHMYGTTSNLSFSEIRAHCRITCDQAQQHDVQGTSHQPKCVPAVKGPHVELIASMQERSAGLKVDHGTLGFMSPHLSQPVLAAGTGDHEYYWPFRCPEAVLLRGLVSSVQFTPRWAGTYFVSCDVQGFCSNDLEYSDSTVSASVRKHADGDASVNNPTFMMTFVHGKPDFAQSFGVVDGRTLQWEDTIPTSVLEDERGGQVEAEDMAGVGGSSRRGVGNNTVPAGFHRISIQLRDSFGNCVLKLPAGTRLVLVAQCSPRLLHEGAPFPGLGNVVGAETGECSMGVEPQAHFAPRVRERPVSLVALEQIPHHPEFSARVEIVSAGTYRCAFLMVSATTSPAVTNAVAMSAIAAVPLAFDNQFGTKNEWTDRSAPVVLDVRPGQVDPQICSCLPFSENKPFEASAVAKDNTIIEESAFASDLRPAPEGLSAHRISQPPARSRMVEIPLVDSQATVQRLLLSEAVGEHSQQPAASVGTGCDAQQTYGAELPGATDIVTEAQVARVAGLRKLVGQVALDACPDFVKSCVEHGEWWPLHLRLGLYDTMHNPVSPHDVVDFMRPPKSCARSHESSIAWWKDRVTVTLRKRAGAQRLGEGRPQDAFAARSAPSSMFHDVHASYTVVGPGGTSLPPVATISSRVPANDASRQPVDLGNSIDVFVNVASEGDYWLSVAFNGRPLFGSPFFFSFFKRPVRVHVDGDGGQPEAAEKVKSDSVGKKKKKKKKKRSCDCAAHWWGIFRSQCVS
eukprot:INCI14754.10.p1 GENE.INCI14754.10~~INCI14754.10.p1  ORF type:complete len:1503 (-),score=172.14 INCI14754.10:1699-6207(-)